MNFKLFSTLSVLVLVGLFASLLQVNGNQGLYSMSVIDFNSYITLLDFENSGYKILTNLTEYGLTSTTSLYGYESNLYALVLDPDRDVYLFVYNTDTLKYQQTLFSSSTTFRLGTYTVDPTTSTIYASVSISYNQFAIASYSGNSFNQFKNLYTFPANWNPSNVAFDFINQILYVVYTDSNRQLGIGVYNVAQGSYTSFVPPQSSSSYIIDWIAFNPADGKVYGVQTYQFSSSTMFYIEPQSQSIYYYQTNTAIEYPGVIFGGSSYGDQVFGYMHVSDNTTAISVWNTETGYSKNSTLTDIYLSSIAYCSQ